MAIYPNSDPSSYNNGTSANEDKQILDRMQQFYQDSIQVNQSFWIEASNDSRFEAGDQEIWNEIYRGSPGNNKRQFNFNRIRRIINMISGYQRRNRKSIVVSPVENGDTDTADQFTKIMYWLNRKEGVLNTVSDAFHGGLVTGLNLLQVWVDYRSDPVSGDIKLDKCAYNSFLMDPFFKKADLSDCNGIWRRSYLTRQECASMVPEKAEELMNLPLSPDSRDGKFNFMPESFNVGPKNLLAYDEFYYRDYRTQLLLIDTQTGDTFEWRQDKNEALDEFLAAYPQITMTEQQIPTVNVAMVVNNLVLYNGPNPMGIDVYPFVPVFGYFRPELEMFDKRIQGVVRSLRDPQYLYNRRKVIELDTLESVVNTGWIHKEGAVLNPDDTFKTGQGRTLVLADNPAPIESLIKRIDPPVIPPTTLQVSELMAKEMPDIAGANEELMGSAVDDKAGILAMLRQGAGLTTLQDLFDNLDLSLKLVGDIFLSLIQTNFVPAKVQRIIEQKPSPQFYHKAFGKYDAAVEEGLNTTTQKQTQFAQLLHLKEVGLPIPDDTIIEAATLQNKKELIAAMEQEKQQAQQMQQMQLQSEMAEQKARTDLANARAIADKGLGIERVSRVQENEAFAVERMAEAQKDRAQGVLNIAKALQEMEGVDLAQVEQLLNMLTILKQGEQQTSLQAKVSAPTTGKATSTAQTAKPNLASLLGAL